METKTNNDNLHSRPFRNGLRGLSPEEVFASRAAHGANILTPRERIPWWRKLGEKFTDPLIIILLIAAALSIGISFYEYFGLGSGSTAFFEPIGIIVAIVLATGLAFWFEHQADREFSLLNQQNDQEPIRVIRNGHETLIPRCELVVGDLVLLSTGDEVPADGTLLEATQMQVDESTLTGEPVCHKGAETDEQDPEATFPTNTVLRGTKLLEGHGLMCVTAVGDYTEAGRVFTEVQIDSTVRTPLNEQLDRLGLLISRASYAIATLIVTGRIFMWFATAEPSTLSTLGAELSAFEFQETTYRFLTYLLQSVMLAVTLIVVAVPEGLPMAVTLSLAYSMRKMLKTNNLVRKMHACETMGAATVICTDKTGTLTQNQMRVAEIVGMNGNISTTTASEHGKNISPDIALNIAVNSTASLDHERVLGNPTEGALLLWLRNQGIDYLTLRAEAQVVEEIPFNTERKYMATRISATPLTHQQNQAATPLPLQQNQAVVPSSSDEGSFLSPTPVSINAVPPSSDTLLYIKGAPEIVMELCKSASPSSSANNAPTTALLLQWQQRGLRTLALAHASGTDVPVLDALVAIADPVRSDVPAAVRECLDAGIDVKIVTGDTPATATEIARQIGLFTPDAGPSLPADKSAAETATTTARHIITGPEVAALSDEELRGRAHDITIIARARPMDKQRLVQALQARGEVVAVTGDGTNDAPALKAAHAGLSMGDGTAVAKEASDITIVDNSFASIGRAVKWGRSLYRNIQRFILFQLTVNVCACLTVLTGAFMGTDAPLTVTQMLWVNLIMDTFAAMALASLPPTGSVMSERPRDRRKFIISSPMWQFIIIVGGLFSALMTGLLWLFEHADVQDLSDFISLLLHGQQQWNHDELTPIELSLFFTTFVMLQFWNLFNARAFLTRRSAFDLRDCRGFLIIVLLIFFGQILIVEFGGALFNVVPLEWDEWLVIVLVTSLVLIIGECVRFIKRLLNHPSHCLS